MTEISLVRFRICTKCGCTKPATTEFFYPHYVKTRYLRPYCKTCHSLCNKAYKIATRAQSVEYNRRWYEQNRANNPEYLEQLRLYRETNKQKRREYMQRYRRENREALLVSKRVRNATRRARKRDAGGSYSSDDLRQMYEQQEGLCCWCETPLLETFHADHFVPLSKGGQNTVDNLALSCPNCNTTKACKLPLEFVEKLGYAVI